MRKATLYETAITSHSLPLNLLYFSSIILHHMKYYIFTHLFIGSPHLPPQHNVSYLSLSILLIPLSAQYIHQ